MITNEPHEIIAWAYYHREIGNFSLATVKPTIENCHLTMRPRTLKRMPLRFELPDPDRSLGLHYHTPFAWAWWQEGMRGWAIGRRRPRRTERWYVKHPEDFAKLTIRGLYAYDYEME